MPYLLERDSLQKRQVVAFPRVDEFFNLLQDRLHMELEGYFFEHTFTLFINALPRDEPMVIDRYQDVPLIYAGVPHQREQLEGPPKMWKEELDEHWNHLDASELNSESAVVSSLLYAQFKAGTYAIADIPSVSMGQLSDYFASILYPESAEREPTSRQKAEYHILSSYFNIMTGRYLSLPLIQFGEFDGVVHLVYDERDHDELSIKAISKIIKSFSIVYESLILDWDLVGRNLEKTEAIQLSMSPVFYDEINKNPILRELKYEKYYKSYLSYFKDRIRLNDRVIHSKVYSPYLKAAIISIMIDSYAHNISAHSLIALNWWFKRRADNLKENKNRHRQELEEFKDIVRDNIPSGYDSDRLLELVTPWLKGSFISNMDEEYDVVKYPGPLDKELHPLMKFLMQKGAFWSGIARDNHFGGESTSLFNVFWADFVNNPLYLGTIAKSEDIHKITLKFILYQEDKKRNERLFSCQRAKRALVEGTLVEIDIKDKRAGVQMDENNRAFLTTPSGVRLFLDDHKELEDISDFVQPGEEYAKIKEILKDTRVFFPGEIVGRHAFFTLLENEIRNVKHYKGADLQKIQENGLELNISIQETNIKYTNQRNKENELYRIGVWIGTPTTLQIDNVKPLIRKKFDALSADIMDVDTFAPRLGGNFQDKICAGMLFNNKFIKVQSGDNNSARDKTGDTERDYSYYPWIVPATSPEDHPHDDIEVCKKVKESDIEFTLKYNHQRGYFKKYFHLWRAANINYVSRKSDTDLSWENLARFQFVALGHDAPNKQSLWEKTRQQGVIRIIDNAAITTKRVGVKPVISAYKSWLNNWVISPSLCIEIKMDDLLMGKFIFDKNSHENCHYYNTNELTIAPNDCSQSISINLAHGGFSSAPNQLRYRSHGIYKTYFTKEMEEGMPIGEKSTARMLELFEVLATKISIFDNRIKLRIKNNEVEDIYREVLQIETFDEGSSFLDNSGKWVGNWEDKKINCLETSQFLILHLSFIEKLLLTKYGDHPDYADENIGLFIQEEIIPYITQNGKIRENFILVITSGRGRSNWWKKLHDESKYIPYTQFTIFRPIESLISGIEDALSRKDDIELKYNLVKVLFGS